MKKKVIISIVSVLAVLLMGAAFTALYTWKKLNSNSLTSKDGKEHRIYVYPDMDLNAVLNEINQHYRMTSPKLFEYQCRMMKFTTPRTGSYLLPNQFTTKQLIQQLRSGLQTPINLSFNNIRTREQLAARIGEQLMIDSLDIITRLESDSIMAYYDLKKETAVCMFLPNTYSMYWNISADELFERMNKEYQHFWTAERDEKAKALGLSRTDVATIASICEEENNKSEEYPTIAGLYINRLKKGMLLQSCPTVKFALQDFTLRRVLDKHLQVDSPYNTYKYASLPPGPIRLAKASTLDAVLNREKHDYLFMCASADFNGYHHFSKTYQEHSRYAREYQRALNKKGIK